MIDKPAYEKLIKEDIEFLYKYIPKEKQNMVLEFGHIIKVLEESINYTYGN